MQAHDTGIAGIDCAMEDCTMGDGAALTPDKRIKLPKQIKTARSDLCICQPAHGDEIIEVRHKDGPAFYLAGLTTKAPLAAVAFCTSHDNQSHHTAAENFDHMVAVITEMVKLVATADSEMCKRTVIKDFTLACKFSHSTMTFDEEDVATKLRLIADGGACEFDSYTALRCS
jgi:hypothetical protein